LVTKQYGFRKDLPTEHAAYSITDSILHAWNSKIHNAVNFCDVAKAFNIEAAVLWAKRYIYTLVQISFI
jgi:hypothetical protein